MIHSTKNQKGITFLTLVFLLILISFFVLLILKITPIYMNHSKVVNALSAVENMENVEKLSKSAIEDSLYKRFNMNYVDKVSGDDITIIKQGQYIKVEIAYERVEKIMGNLSVLVEFYESFEAGDD